MKMANWKIKNRSFFWFEKIIKIIDKDVGELKNKIVQYLIGKIS